MKVRIIVQDMDTGEELLRREDVRDFRCTERTHLDPVEWAGKLTPEPVEPRCISGDMQWNYYPAKR